VALENLRIIVDEQFPSQAAAKGAYLLDQLRRQLADHPHVGELRGLGLMCAVELVRDRATKAEFSPDQQVGRRVHAAAQQRGLFSRLRGDVFCLAPPIVTPEPLLEQIATILAESVREVLGPGC
jgi:adenosylmethionine-8-amino-7-oxononanoate aminotransferase